MVALCLREESVKELQEKCSSRFHALICDVTATDVEYWKGLQDSVSKISNGKIYAIVNNAGVLHYGPIEWVDLPTFQADMNVNFYGIVRVTKCLLPLLKKTKSGGRIVNVASVAGFFSAAFTSPYSCSKYAVEGFSEALRREMAGFNIEVVLVEPAIMQTAMLNDYDKFGSLFEQQPQDQQDSYGRQYLHDAVSVVRMWRTGVLLLATLISISVSPLSFHLILSNM